MRAAGRAVWVVALAAPAARPAAAQLSALPVYSFVTPASQVLKLAVFADYGHGSGAARGRRFLGTRVLLAPRGRVFAAAGAGQVRFDVERLGSVASVAVGAGVVARKLPRFPVALVQAGVGYVAFGDALTGRVRQLDVPVALAVGLYAPLAATFRVWLAPRIQLRHVASGAPLPPLPRASGWQVGLGGAGGASVTLRYGLGLQVAYDAVWIGGPFTAVRRLEGAVGLGALWVHGF